MKHIETTEKIIKAYYAVYNALGYGFLEKVYENALVIELERMGIVARSQYPVKVFYAGAVVGEYVADMLVEDTVIVEIKVARQLSSEHEAQLLNYLNATQFEVGLLLNFGPKAEFKRKIFDNDLKKYHPGTKPN